MTDQKSVARERTIIGMLVLPLLVLAFAFGWGLDRVAEGIKNRSSDVISVRGTAQRNVKADAAVWRLTVTESGETAATALNKVAVGLEIVEKFFADNQVDDDAISLGSVSTYANKEYIDGNATGRILSFEATREITLRLDDVDKIAMMSSDLGVVLSQGVQIYTSGPEYYLKSLTTLRPELLAEAMLDAQTRAQSLLQAVDANVGAVRGVSSGPFQVTAADSTDVESGGYYDTRSINKTVIATITVEFTNSANG